MRDIAKNIFRRVVGERQFDYVVYRRHHRWLLKHNGFDNHRAYGEDAYKAQWHRLSRKVEPYSYRLFSHYCGPTPDIVPEDIMHDIIELRLNPRKHWDEYEDKNNFAKYLDANLLPETIAYRQGNGPINKMLAFGSRSSLILKPSVNTSCGESVMQFSRVGERYLSIDGIELTDSYLQSYGTDWVLQESVRQHPDMQRFCRTAVSTVRMVVYRSLVDGSPHVTAAVLRVGADGSVVDNIVAGGRFLKVNIADGTIEGPFISRFGSRSNVWNGLDITSDLYRIPSWDAVLQLSEKVADHMGPHHLIALDIAINEQGRPILIEYNIGGFTTYLFHFTGQTVLGPYTEEVISSLSAVSTASIS